MRTALTSGAGPHSQPIFQPVVLNVLPPLEMTERALAHAGQRGHRDVLGTVEHEVLVHLVGEHQQIVLDREVGDELHLVAGEHAARGVVRRVEQDELGLRGDGGAQLVGVEGVARAGAAVTGLATAPAIAMHGA